MEKYEEIELLQQWQELRVWNGELS